MINDQAVTSNCGQPHERKGHVLCVSRGDLVYKITRNCFARKNMEVKKKRKKKEEEEKNKKKGGLT